MEQKPARLTHMMIENVNARVSQTHTYIIAGIFLTMAFSAATFGLTLGAAEFSKESHVHSVQAGGAPVFTDNDGQPILSNKPAIVEKNVYDIICENPTRQTVSKALEDLVKYSYYDASRDLITMQVVGVAAHQDASVTLRGMAGEQVTITRSMACGEDEEDEEADGGRKLLQSRGGGNGGFYGGGGGGGGGGGSGSGSGCEEDGRKKDGNKLKKKAGMMVQATLRGFYDEQDGGPSETKKPTQFTIGSLGGPGLYSKVNLKDNGWMTLQSGFDMNLCEQDSWKLDAEGNMGVELLNAVDYDGLLDDPNWHAGGGFELTLEGAYGSSHEFSAGISLKGTAGGADAGWYANYKYTKGTWDPLDGYPAPSSFRVVLPSSFTLGVTDNPKGDGSGTVGTAVQAKIFYSF